MNRRPLYPEIVFRLSDTSGNAAACLVKIRRLLLRGGVPIADVDQFSREAAGDIYHVITVAQNWIQVE